MLSHSAPRKGVVLCLVKLYLYIADQPFPACIRNIQTIIHYELSRSLMGVFSMIGTVHCTILTVQNYTWQPCKSKTSRYRCDVENFFGVCTATARYDPFEKLESGKPFNRVTLEWEMVQSDCTISHSKGCLSQAPVKFDMISNNIFYSVSHDLQPTCHKNVCILGDMLMWMRVEKGCTVWHV